MKAIGISLSMGFMFTGVFMAIYGALTSYTTLDFIITSLISWFVLSMVAYVGGRYE